MQVFNEFGDELFGGRTFYRVYEGQCLVENKASANPYHVPGVGTQNDLWSFYASLYTMGFSTIRYDAAEMGAHFAQIAAPAFYASPPFGPGVLFSWIFPQPATNRIDDLIFIGIPPEGIIWGGYIVNRLPEVETGLFAYIITRTNTPVPYLVASEVPPAGPQPEGMGLVLQDETGAVTFDSRIEAVPIRDYYLLTRAVAETILMNNAIIDIALRQPIPNAKVSLPHWANAEKRGGNTNLVEVNPVALIRITQPDSQTIRLSRWTTADWSPAAPFRWGYRHDCFMMFTS